MTRRGGLPDQRRKLAVIGVGALGSALVQLLAEHAFDQVMLIDADVPEERNLPVSPFLQDALASQSNNTSASANRVRIGKAELLAAHVRSRYGLPWQAFSCEVADLGWQHLRAVDLLCCCTDSALSRAETAFVARSLQKPVLDGAVTGKGIAAGRVTRFHPGTEAACYLCGMGEDRRAAVLGYAASTTMGCRVPEDAASMDSTLSTLRYVAETMLGAIQQSAASEVGEQSVATRIWSAPASNPVGHDCWHRESVTLTRSITCPWHWGTGTDLTPLPWETPLLESLGDKTSGWELRLAWPVCTEALCSVCRHRYAPYLRVAAVRRAPCPHCGQVTLQPLQGMHRIRAMDTAACRSPRQLAQPDQHLYSFVMAANAHSITMRSAL